MINWKKVGEHTPTNAHKYGGDTPFIRCLVYICPPKSPTGGMVDILGWNTKMKSWDENELREKWWKSNCIITHFCDDYNKPNDF